MKPIYRFRKILATQGSGISQLTYKSFSGQACGSRICSSIQPLYSSQKLAFVRMARHSDLSTAVLNRYSTSCTGTITGAPAVSKAQSRFLQLRLTARWQSPHSMQIVLRQSRPVVRRNLQRCELVEVKQETDKISLQSQIVRSVTTRHIFYEILPVCGKVFISGTVVSVRSSYIARYPAEDFCQPPSCRINTTRLSFICMTLNIMLSATR